MTALYRFDGAARAQLDNLHISYRHAARACTDPQARRNGDALRSASKRLWNAGGPKNVTASVRASQLALLAVQPIKLSCGTNADFCAARAAANGAIGHELDDDDPRVDDIRPLDDLAEAFWYRGDDKHGRAAVAVLDVIECLLTVEVSA